MRRRFSVRDLGRFAAGALGAAGAPTEVAETVAESLVFADMRGISSHGLVRLPIYTERLLRSMVSADAEPELKQCSAAAWLMDGRNNFGAYTGVRAMTAAIEAARKTGIALVGVSRSNHFGTAAYFARLALKENQIAIVTSNASQTMPPTGGRRPFVGTNPLCIACPVAEGAPFMLDMATSVVARGKIIFAAQNGQPIPEGWAVDAQGLPTRDALAALDGAVLPLGGPKGFGLAIALDLLSGALTGAGAGPTVRNMYEDWSEPQNVGHLFIAIDIGQLQPIEDFRARMAEYLAALKASPRAPGCDELLYAGELEARRQEESAQSGVALPDGLLDELDTLAGRLGIDPFLPVDRPLQNSG